MSICAYTCKAHRRIKTFLSRQKIIIIIIIKSIDVKNFNKYVIKERKWGKWINREKIKAMKE